MRDRRPLRRERNASDTDSRSWRFEWKASLANLLVRIAYAAQRNGRSAAAGTAPMWPRPEGCAPGSMPGRYHEAQLDGAVPAVR